MFNYPKQDQVTTHDRIRTCLLQILTAAQRPDQYMIQKLQKSNVLEICKSFSTIETGLCYKMYELDFELVFILFVKLEIKFPSLVYLWF